ncbi:hypothetical protein HYH03_009195 [Edaphochlamys debaryana]|uniref:Uncharacterized protein n=1 Tax=Edaphochlamys debaryana TaxID=47281 RepID=A0A835Y4U3_9CHLO|nr:hypothetical protein HYH03_009195 [Edaphochlamys debaryana]|eukprot:KAG2492530.1 hypothetical protein HYH03_009195 [Edaphochlamys debaryana]
MQQAGLELINASQALHAAGVAMQAGQDPVELPPPWAQELFAPLQQGLNNVLQGVNNLQQTLLPVTIEAVRCHNAQVMGDAEPLMGVPDAGGRVPAAFPPTRAHLRAMGGPQLTALLQAYGLVPHQEVAGRRQQLAAYIRLAPLTP